MPAPDGSFLPASESAASPAAVIHLDRIYIPSLQPLVEVAEVVFRYPRGREELIMKDGRYVIF